MIRRSIRIGSALLLALTTVACGKVGALEPRAGNAMPPKAYGQKAEQTAEALTTPSVQARPGRSDELLRRSERRVEDPFDLPPGEDPKPVTPADTKSETKPAPK
jgi:hypothetical protein